MDTIEDPGLVLKTTPPKLRKSLLVRDRLRRLRASAEDTPVFVVEAPAGYGKTSLLAQWRLDWQQGGAAVAWLSLDAGDTPTRVVSGMVLGLRRAVGRPAFGTEAVEAVRRGAGTEPALTALLAEIAEAAAPMVIIADNFERVADEAVKGAFDYLLHNLPPNLQFAAGSRPPAPLDTIGLLGHDSLRRVTAADLRFDLPETIHLLSARLGERGTPDLCARLHEMTEGWPLGLQLAATSLEHAVDPAQAMQTFASQRDDATRQLLDGMVDALSPELAGFLTRCSLLHALHPSLCEAATECEQAPLLLQRLVVETPLLTAAEESDWVRLHALAREHLRARAERVLPETERRDFRVRAWRWLADHGLPEPAAQQALAAGYRKEALALVAGTLIDEFDRGHAGTVLEWLARIPAEEIRSNLGLRVVALWMRSMSYDTARDALPELLALAEDPAAEDRVRGEALLMVTNVYGYADDLDVADRYSSRYPATVRDARGQRVRANQEAAIAMFRGATESARQVLSRVPDTDGPQIAKIWRDFFVCLSYLWEGRPVLAEQVAAPLHARWEAGVGRRAHWTSMLASLLAAACWQRDLRDEARALLVHRIDVIEQHTLPEGVIYAYRTLAQIAAAEGDEARAFGCLEALAGIGARRNLPRFVVVSLAERVRLHAAGRRPQPAASLLDELAGVLDRQVVCAMIEPRLRLDQALAQAFAALAFGDPGSGAVAVETALALARRLNRGYETVQALALEALLAECTGVAQTGALIEALSLAEAGGLVRVFADTLPAVVDLVRRLAEAGAHAPVSRGFIERVLGAASQRAVAEGRDAPASAAGNAILTPKENEVLRGVVRGLPNKRIASELGLSAETVKWHMKKLFTKLNAASREHAVDRARMLGLVP